MKIVHLMIGIFMILSCQNSEAQNQARRESVEFVKNQGDGLYAIMSTSRGDIILSLAYEKAPMTVANFVGLAEGTLEPNVRRGQPFYNGLNFHRVVADFVIQGGDPLGTGRGGPGYKFPDEITDLTHDQAGILSMANAGPDTNGSQFFITLRPTPHLDGRHSVFGKVIKGLDVVQSTQLGDKINSVTIIRNGTKAEQFRPNQEFFDRLVQAAIQKRRDEAAQKSQADLAQVNQRWPNARVTTSGLRFILQKAGSGSKPARGQTILAHYEGRLLDDQVFDSSYQRGQPLEFQVGVGMVIPGWDEALMDMRVGEKRTLIIPPNLGYGEAGAADVIPPNSWLVFDVELVQIKQ